MPDWSHINQHISDATGAPFLDTRQQGVGGGSINAAYVLRGDDGRQFFVKLNSAALIDMFAAEAEGLQELASAQAIKVPNAICWGNSDKECYIVMEYLSLSGKNSGHLLGQHLAAVHRKSWDKFGWVRDNTIGSTPQSNTPSTHWVEFYRVQRLGFQLGLAANNGGSRLLDQGERLLTDLNMFFTDYQPAPSLLHGDLWGGNYATDGDGNPVIFDPAVYYGDREADIAMTELFGGFPRDFYVSYNDVWPLDAGYATRKTLYNLYHVTPLSGGD